MFDYLIKNSYKAKSSQTDLTKLYVYTSNVSVFKYIFKFKYNEDMLHIIFCGINFDFFTIISISVNVSVAYANVKLK